MLRSKRSIEIAATKQPLFKHNVRTRFQVKAIANLRRITGLPPLSCWPMASKVGLKTIKQMIGRWAPPNENDTGAYVRIVAGSVGVDAGQTINTHDYEILHPLTLAIIRHESGQQPYTDAGLVLAGVEPPQRPLAGSRTVQGGQVAAGATVLGLTAKAVQQIEPAIPLLRSALQ